MNPHDPDPLVVLEDQERPLIMGQFSRGMWSRDPSGRTDVIGVEQRRPHNRLAVAILVALAFGLGLFIGVRFAAAAPRDGQLPLSDAGHLGASQNVGANGSGESQRRWALLVHPEPRNRAGSGWMAGSSPATESGAPTPSPVTLHETLPGITGTASWYPAHGLIAAAGPALRTGDWRGRLVVVSANGRSVTVTLSDWCLCPRRLIDLSDDAFARLAPLSRGLVQVIVTPAGPRPTPPATDTGGNQP